MYAEGERLVLVEDFGRKDSDKFLPKNTEVEYIKVIHTDDISFCMVIVKYEDRIFPLKETLVKPKDEKKIKREFDSFNRTLMRNNPELRIYHPNPVLRVYYRLFYYFKGLLNGRKK